MVAEDMQPNKELCPAGAGVHRERTTRGSDGPPPSYTREVTGFYCLLAVEHLSDRKIFDTWANANANNLGPLCPIYADICVCA